MTAEIPVWATHGPHVLLAGRADAVVMDEVGKITTVLDWKSDVAPSAADRMHHAGQLSDYLTATGVPRGTVVYMSLGETVWISSDRLVRAR